MHELIRKEDFKVQECCKSSEPHNPTNAKTKADHHDFWERKSGHAFELEKAIFWRNIPKIPSFASVFMWHEEDYNLLETLGEIWSYMSALYKAFPSQQTRKMQNIIHTIEKEGTLFEHLVSLRRNFDENQKKCLMLFQEYRS